MPKRRKSHLPPYVWLNRLGVAYWQPYTGRGKPRPAYRLTEAGAPTSEIWAAWERQRAELEGSARDTLRWLLESYRESPQFRAHSDGKPKAPDTIREQTRQVDAICRRPRGGGKDFGSAPLSAITPGVLRKYLDARAQGAPVAGNRELALISVAWGWALERDLTTLANPCRKVRRISERPSDRYVTDEEYRIGYEIAGEGPPWAQPAMELAMLCRLRGVEVREMRKSDITPEGLITRRRKGSKNAITAWSPRLRAAVDAALATSPNATTLLADRRGKPIEKHAWESYWSRWVVKLEARGVARFTFHQLGKVKGVSDTEGDKQKASGHKTMAMVSRYDRKPSKVEPTR